MFLVVVGNQLLAALQVIQTSPHVAAMTVADPLDEILRFAVVNPFADDPLNFLFEVGLPSLCLVGLHRDDARYRPGF